MTIDEALDYLEVLGVPRTWKLKQYYVHTTLPFEVGVATFEDKVISVKGGDTRVGDTDGLTKKHLRFIVSKWEAYELT